MKPIRYVLIMSFLLFIALTFTYDCSLFRSWDETIKQTIDRLSHPYVTAFFLFLSFVGSTTVLFPFYVVWGLICMHKKNLPLLIALTFNFFGVRYINTQLKLLIARERPEWPHLTHVTGYSFPSDHAMNSTAFFVFLCILIFHKRIRYRIYWIILFISLPLLISVSRIYLGVHYPTDVIDGIIGGIMWASLSYQLYHQLQTVYSTKQQ